VSEPWKVIIVGGGFGGLRAAQALKSTSVEVTLIDRRNHHVFQPLLYQVATGSLSPGEIAAPTYKPSAAGARVSENPRSHRRYLNH
jgi:NADH dehydrogenase FAD-containing subunit